MPVFQLFNCKLCVLSVPNAPVDPLTPSFPNSISPVSLLVQWTHPLGDVTGFRVILFILGQRQPLQSKIKTLIQKLLSNFWDLFGVEIVQFVGILLFWRLAVLSGCQDPSVFRATILCSDSRM